jgi:DNA polymerase-3 subunit beta
MKVTVKRESFLEALQDVVPVVPSKSPHPMLGNALLEAKDGDLVLLATDLDLSVQAKIPAPEVEIGETGKTCVSARKLMELVRELETDEVEVSLEGSQLEVRAGGRFALVTADPSDFPEIPGEGKGTALEIPAGRLQRLIRRTAYAVATDETRPELTGVYMQVLPDELRTVATNGHRLALASLKGSFPLEKNFLIPTKSLNHLLRMMSDPEESVQIRGDGAYVYFQLGNRTLVTRLLEGPFPRYEQVIPKNNPHVVRVNVASFTAMLRRALVIADPSSKQVRIQLSPGKIQMLVRTQNVGEAVEEMDADYDGEEVRIGFNGGYLQDLLRTFDSEMAQMEFAGSTQAGVFRPYEENPEEPLLCLVMPLRLTDEPV